MCPKSLTCLGQEWALLLLCSVLKVLTSKSYSSVVWDIANPFRRTLQAILSGLRPANL